MKIKSLTPHVIFVSFSIIVLATGYMTEVFKSPKKTARELLNNIQLFRKEDVSSIQTLLLSNSSGTFQFERNLANNLSPWSMSAPEQNFANSKILEKLFNSLTTSKIKKSFPASQENLKNYSIAESKISLEFIDTLNKHTKIIFGIQNPIDKSIFLQLANNPEIYQVDALEIDIANLSFTDLVEKNLFSINKENLTALHIYRGQKKSDFLVVNVIKNPEEIKGWRISEKENANEDKIFQFLEKIENLKPVTIIENATDIQRKKVEKLFQSPQWTITTEDKNQNTISYTITNAFNDFPNLETKGESFILIKISNQESYYFFKKETLDLFDVDKADFI